MDHLRISVEANDSSWKQRCNERMVELKTAQFPCRDVSSQPGPLQETLLGDKNISPELYKAIEKGNVDNFIDVLHQVSTQKELPLSAIFYQTTLAGDSLLHVAADLGREQISELIGFHFPQLLTKRNIRGDTPLHFAARSNNCGVIKVILSQYAIQKSTCWMEDEEITRLMNEGGDTALHEAVYSGYHSVVTELLHADRPVAHYLNKSDRSPLYLAVLNGNVEILGLLLDVPFPANEPPPQRHGNSPLHAAILGRKPDLLQVILDERPELISLRDEDGGTPLHHAAYIGYVEGVRILLNQSAPTSLQRNTKGHLPIHLACKRGHAKVVKLLLQQEWHPRVLLNRKGQNILHVAVKNGRFLLVLYLLLSKKIDKFTMNQKDKDGNTPLHLASRNLFPQVLFLLTRENLLTRSRLLTREKKTIDVNLVNNEGLTARDVAWLASESLRKNLVNLVLEDAGVPLRAKDLLHLQPQRSPNTGSMTTINTYLVVATLIVTVTFAAGFTVPGGVYSSDDPNPQNRGRAVLADEPLFRAFTFFNSTGLQTAIFASLFLLGAMNPNHEVSRSLIKFAVILLVLSFSTVLVAFTAALSLIAPPKSPCYSLKCIYGYILILFIDMIFLSYILMAYIPGFHIPGLRHLCGYYLLFIAWYKDKPKDSYSHGANNRLGKSN